MSLSTHSMATELLNLTDVKAFSMAHAITSQEQGLSSISTNPAGIMSINSLEIETRYATYFDNDMTVMAVSLGKKFRKLTLGLTIPYKSIDGIPETTSVSGRAKQLGEFSDTETGLVTTLGTRLTKHVTIGMNLKTLHQTVYDQTAISVGMDYGIQFQSRFVQAGICIQNAGKTLKKWSNSTYEEIPQNVLTGVGINLNPNHKLMAQIESGPSIQHVGVAYQYTLDELLEFGLGIQDLGGESMMTYGLSIHTGSLVEIQYSGARHDHLGMIHKIGVKLSF